LIPTNQGAPNDGPSGLAIFVSWSFVCGVLADAMTAREQPARIAVTPRPRPEHAASLIAVDERTSSNAWAEGLRTLECLACGRGFLSAGRHERLCRPCRQKKT
jgi:hypothetical protein